MPDRPYYLKSIRPGMTVRQVAADFPESREVFRSYGEPEDLPGRFGHLEPLTHFARRVGVPLDRLLAELSQVTAVPVQLGDGFAQRVHHGFVLAALAVTLTVGTGWGAWLLWQIGLEGRFSGASPAYVIAHGAAQFWGLIVLMVIGVSLRTVLEGAARHRWGPWICRGILLLGLGGITASLVWFLFPGRMLVLGLAGAAALLMMSLAVWTLQIVFLHTKWRYTWARAVMVSGLWLTVWAAVTLGFRWSAGAGGADGYSEAQRLLLIELAVFGFAMNSIYGFGQMLLPGLLRIGKIRSGAVEWGHWVHNAGAAMACVATAGSTAGLATGGLLATVGSALLALGAVLFAVGLRGFVGRRRSSFRDEQGHAPLDLYPPIAFFWLVASLAMLTAGVFYESATARPLPHAYMGAVRHALTVGFMTTLILGVGQRLLPVLDRTILAMPRLALPILVLIGVGNLLRVGSEMAIMVTPAAFRVMPFSGLLEWLALVLFGASATATMLGKDALYRHGRVTRRSSLAVLLAEHPWIEDRLRRDGSSYLQRTRSVPGELTIGSYAEGEGWNAEEIVARINSWLAEGDRASLQGPSLHRSCLFGGS